MQIPKHAGSCGDLTCQSQEGILLYFYPLWVGEGSFQSLSCSLPQTAISASHFSQHLTVWNTLPSLPVPHLCKASCFYWSTTGRLFSLPWAIHAESGPQESTNPSFCTQTEATFFHSCWHFSLAARSWMRKLELPQWPCQHGLASGLAQPCLLTAPHSFPRQNSGTCWHCKAFVIIQSTLLFAQVLEAARA